MQSLALLKFTTREAGQGLGELECFFNRDMVAIKSLDHGPLAGEAGPSVNWNSLTFIP